MKSSIHFFKDCMYRLSEISVYISRMNKMRRELEELISGSVSADEKKRAIQTMRRIDTALKTFGNTETRIVHTIKKNENYPENIYVAFDETRFAVNNKEYLRKIMQFHHKQLLGLQSIVNEYTKESAEQACIPYPIFKG